MKSTKKTISIMSLNTSKLEDYKKINLITSICNYYDYEYHVQVNDKIDSVNIHIECCSDDDVNKLVGIFLSFDIICYGYP